MPPYIKSITTSAAVLLNRGVDLVGMTVDTIPYGAWPGGNAVISRINPDIEVDGIAFFVKAPFWPPTDDPDAGEEMGVFAEEEVTLYIPKKARLKVQSPDAEGGTA